MLLTNQDSDDKLVLFQLSSELHEPDKHSWSAVANQLFCMMSDLDLYLDPHLNTVCLPTGACIALLLRIKRFWFWLNA